MAESKARKYVKLEDGYVEGRVYFNTQPCGVCGQSTICVSVNQVTPPDGVKPEDRRQILNRVRMHKIGIGCGCYAKGHRQFAHVVDSMRGKS